MDWPLALLKLKGLMEEEPRIEMRRKDSNQKVINERITLWDKGRRVLRRWLGLKCMLSHARLLAVPVDCTSHAPLSMGLSCQEYRSGLPFPLPGDFPDLGIEHTSTMSPALAGGFFTTEPPGNPFKEISSS